MAHPVENAKLILRTDASNHAMGAVLEQLQNQQRKPLRFFSKKLSQAQQKYSTYDRELLAIYSSLKFFRHLVEGRDVTILTDHKPLQYAFLQASDKSSERQKRQLDFISQITTKIIHVAGKENTITDALSRIDAIDMPQIVTRRVVRRTNERRRAANAATVRIKSIAKETAVRQRGQSPILQRDGSN